MTNTKRKPSNRPFIAMTVGSLLLHFVVIAILGPYLDFDLASEPQKPLEVNVVRETPTMALKQPPKNQPIEEKKEEPPTPEPAPEEEEEVVKVQPPNPDNRKAVEQVTNEERPEVANFLSRKDNKVDEETRARETTLKNAIPSNSTTKETSPKKETTPQEQEKKQLSKHGEMNPKKVAEVDGLIRKKSPEKIKEKGNPFAMPNLAMAKEILPDPGHDHSHEDGRVLFEGYEEREEAFRASMENFIHEVRPGNHTGVNAHQNIAASYLAEIHRKIHVLWGQGYLIQLDLREPRGSDLHEPSLNTRLEFVINSEDGAVESVNIVKSSGQFVFDAEAVSISHQVGPHPKPPPEVISPNGKVYVHWNFWRDQRQCGTFGASIYLVDTDKG